jgi:hypothetical protein
MFIEAIINPVKVINPAIEIIKRIKQHPARKKVKIKKNPTPKNIITYGQINQAPRFINFNIVVY